MNEKKLKTYTRIKPILPRDEAKENQTENFVSLKKAEEIGHLNAYYIKKGIETGNIYISYSQKTWAGIPKLFIPDLLEYQSKIYEARKTLGINFKGVFSR